MLLRSEARSGARWRRKIGKAVRLFLITGVRPRHLVIPIVLSFLVAVFSGVGLGLLVPVAKGLSSGDFSFIEGVPVIGRAFGWVLAALEVDEGSSQAIFLLLIGGIIMAQILRSLLVFVTHLYVSWRNGMFRKRIASTLFERYLSFGKQFFDMSSQGMLQTTLGYANEVTRLLTTLQTMASAFFQVGIRLVVMVMISWQLTMMALLVVPVLYAAIRIKARKLRRFSRMRREAHMQLGKEAFNTLTGMTLVKSCAREKEMAERFGQLLENFRRYDLKAETVHGMGVPAQEIIILLAFAVVAYFAGSMYQGDSVEHISLLVVFLYAASGILPQFGALGRGGLVIADLSAPLEQVLGIFDDEGKFRMEEGRVEFGGLRKSIALRNVEFAYTEEQPVLRGVTFTVRKDEVVALVGPSGAGKTTVVNLLLRLYECPSRSILIDGTDIRELQRESLQRRIGYVSQEPILFNDTLRYNMTFGLERLVSDEELWIAARQARLLDTIEGLPKRLDTEIGDRGVQLSGGEKQRLSIARAFLKKADILILDEATSSLDSGTERLIQEAVHEAVRGRTAIVIAHRLSTITHADRIVVVRAGRVIEEGTLDGLLAQKGLFFSLWEAQQFY